MPPVLVEPIRRHHSLTGAQGQSGELAKVVYCAVLCGQLFAARLPGLIERTKAQLIAVFPLPDATLTAMFMDLGQQTEQLAGLFAIEIDPGRIYQDLQDEARQMLLELSLATHQESQQMQEQNQHLWQKATTDELTGLANRAHFVQYLETEFAAARRTKQPLALLFLDGDRFKAINDTYGHQAGDEVLVRPG